MIPDIRGSFPQKSVRPIEPVDVTPRICYCDIETYDKHGFATGDNPFAEILSIGLYDNFKDKYMIITHVDVEASKIKKIFKETYGEDIELIVKKVRNEHQVLVVFRSFLDQIKPDIICGWYFQDFDWAYIQGRCERLDIEFDDSTIQVFDLLQGFKNLSVRATSEGKEQPKNLDYVGNALLGKGKVDHQRMWQMMEENPSRLAAYNLGDVYLCKEIDNVKNIISHYLMVCEVTGCSLDDVFYASKIVDSIMFHYLRETDIVLPSKGMMFANPIKKGGAVHKASHGIMENIGVVDNKQEYPSIMRTLNMSPETKVGPDYNGSVFIAPSGTRYRQLPRGLIPRILDELLEIRNGIKKEMKELIKKDPKNRETPEWKSLDNRQEAFKYSINSVYGVLGNVDRKTGKTKWRLADGDIGSDVTNVGRDHVEWNSQMIDRQGHLTIYGDTDSSMFQFFHGEEKTFEEYVQALSDTVDYLNGTFDQFAAQFNCKSHYFEVESKCIYERFFQAGTKKKYAGLRSWIEGMDIREWSIEDRMEIVGMSIIRSDTPEIQKIFHKKIITMALTGVTLEEIRAYLKELYNNFMDGKFDLKMGIPCGIGKTSYKKVPIHIRASEWSSRNLGMNFIFGDRPIWWYVKTVKNTDESTDVAALEWGQHPNDYGLVIDYERMRDRVLMSDGNNIILEAMGISWSEVLSGMIEQKLDDFF